MESAGTLRLYHFLGEEHGLLALENKRLKVSLPNSLNDPFDHRGIDTSDKQQRRAIRNGINQMSRVQGLLCFSIRNSSPVMWAHYADRHKGLCLGFDVPEEAVVKVDYVADLLPSSAELRWALETDDASFFDRLVRTKHAGWSYEEEYRAFVDLRELTVENGLYFFFLRNANDVGGNRSWDGVWHK